MRVNIRGEHYRRAKYVVGAFVAFVAFMSAANAALAQMYVTPSSGAFPVGKTFNVVIRISSDQAANAAEGTLNFDPQHLRVQSLSGGGSIFNLNVQQPEFSNSAGTVRFAGVILNPGFSGAGGNLLTVTFKAVSEGSTRLSLSGASILANDGKGTDITGNLGGATYSVTEAAAATPQPEQPAETAASSSLLPDVTSPTHPDPTQWYANNNPEFKWPLPQGVDGVSYIVSPKPTANPGNESDGVASSVRFTGVADGASYFHIKFHTKSGWGPIRHFAFNADMNPPASFAVQRLDATDTTNPNPRLTFQTTDSASGVARYAMKIGDGDWFAVDAAPTDHPYTMPPQSPGSHEVLVDAVDHAGNSIRAALAVTVESITVPTITQYPARLQRSAPFVVSGLADPGVTVSVVAHRNTGRFGGIVFDDSVAGSAEAVTDSVGHWTVTMPALQDGGYTIHAAATDSRQAVSNPSDAVSIQIGYSIMERIGDFFRGFLSGWSWISVFAWLLLIFSILLIVVGLRQRRTHGRGTGTPGLKRSERASSDKLQELSDDINDELQLLSKVAKHRPLYPEEKYLRSKLMQYQRTIRVLQKSPGSRLAKTK
jgi:hypothetical protein